MTSEEKKSGISFGFSRTTESKKLKTNSLKDDDPDKKEIKDYIISVEDNNITGTHKEPKKEELVIPLITTNRWRSARRPEELDQQGGDDTTKDDTQTDKLIKTGDAAVDEAVSELIKDAKQGVILDPESSLSIPLLMKNKIPDGFETDDRLDVSLRPDEALKRGSVVVQQEALSRSFFYATSADYDAVPIEQFGLAMLRGMGWKEGEGVGKNKQSIKPIEAQLRPKGLGLGADRSLEAQKKDSTERVKDEKEEKLEMKKGTHCVVLSGKREGQYGIIVSLDEDNSRAMVAMALGDDVISMSQLCIKLVNKKEYDKCHKYLNKMKADRYQEEQANNESRNSRSDRDQRGDHRKDKDSSNGDDYKSSKRKEERNGRHHDKRERSESRERDQRTRTRNDESSTSRHYDEYDDDDVDHKHSHKKQRNDKTTSNSYSHSKASSWLYANLRVRFIDEKYKSGKYFKEKVVIEDVVTPDTCVCRTSEGRVLEGVHQSQLETVIPRDERSFVMFVSGKHKAQIGELLSRDKKKCTALVQLLSDRDVALTVAYEEICEYAGDIDAEFNY